MQITTEIPTIPDSLNMAALEGVTGRMVIGRDVGAGGFTNDPRPGKPDSTRTNGKLIRRATEKRSHRPGVGIVIVDHQVQATGIDIFPHRHGAFRHLHHPEGALLNANAPVV